MFLDRSTAEVDFVVQYKGVVVPVEVKAEENLQAKSLKVYTQKFNPQVALRTSMSNFRQQDRLINIPLFGISELKKLVNKTTSI